MQPFLSSKLNVFWNSQLFSFEIGSQVWQRRWTSIRRVHRLTPVLMISCFFGGLAVATFHHVYLYTLDGQVVDQYPIPQQWVSRGNSAIAYLVRLFLVVASSVAYVQWAWREARSVPIKIAHLDSMFLSLTNAFEFLDFRFWARRPLLSLAAAAVWLLPLIAIITPGTLSVVSCLRTVNTTVIIQQHEYGVSGYGGVRVADDGSVTYAGAQLYLPGPALATLAQGEILSVGTNNTNISYSTDFSGPAVYCSQAPENIRAALKQTTAGVNQQNNGSLLYNAYIPKLRQHIVNGSTTTVKTLEDVRTSGGESFVDLVSSNAARVYYAISAPSAAPSDLSFPFYVIQCALYNASWHVAFDISSTGGQRVSSSLVFEQPIPGFSTLSPALSASPMVNILADYTALMDIFASIASATAFTNNNSSGHPTSGNFMLSSSPIMSHLILHSNVTDEAMYSLMRSFETMFQNITLNARYAVRSHQELRVAPELPTHLSVDAVSEYLKNCYHYAPMDLVLAYTLAGVATALTITLALVAMADSGAAYTSRFSSVMLATRAHAHELEKAFHEDNEYDANRSGAEPLPSELAELEIWLGHHLQDKQRESEGSLCTADRTRVDEVWELKTRKQSQGTFKPGGKKGLAIGVWI